MTAEEIEQYKFEKKLEANLKKELAAAPKD